MKFLAIFIFPLLLSVLLYVLSFVLVFDYCGCVAGGLGSLRFSGVEYFNDDVSVCIVYGALLSAVALIVPHTIYIYRALNIERLISSGVKVDVKQVFFASVLLLSVYLSLFLVPVSAYSSRGNAVVEAIFNQQLLFYIFLIFPCQLVSGMWAMCLKLKVTTHPFRTNQS